MTDNLTITPIPSIPALAAEWTELLAQSPANTLFLLPQWQEIWWDILGGGRELAGFALRSPGGALTAIASLSRSGPDFSLVGNPETFDYNDFILRPGSELDFFPLLLDHLARAGAQTLELTSLRESSPTLEHLPALARRHGYTVEIAEEDVAPGLELPATWEEYLAGLSKKNRHELRRKLRRLETAANWRWYSVQEPAAVAARLDDFLTLMRQSDPEKAAYMTAQRETFFRRMADRTAQLDLLRLYFLEMDGADVAAALCFDYGGVRYLYNSGYNPDFSYYSVGLLLNALCLRAAIEQGQTYFDFLRGPESYKYHLGGRNRNLYRMMVRKS